MSGRRYWIGVATKIHVDRATSDGICMFAHGRHSAVLRLSPGDRFAYYGPREHLDGGAPVQQFLALGVVEDGQPIPTQMSADASGWMREAAYLPTVPADVYDLLDGLSFVRDRRHWGMYFRRSLFEIDREDMLLIAGAMGVDSNLI